MERSKAKRHLALAMVIFGTVGLFRRWIPLPSGAIASARGLAGMAFLLLMMAVRGQRVNGRLIRKRWKLLLFSGAALGVNWMLLFEAYRYTTVATATLCYYMAPVLLLLSPLLLRERLTALQGGCIAAAVAGMVFVSGVTETGFSASSEWRGVLLGLAAAACYAAVMLCNKRLGDVPALDRTFVQLGVAGLVLLGELLTDGVQSASAMTAAEWALLAVVCIVHTGAAYALYFGAMPALPVQTARCTATPTPLWPFCARRRCCMKGSARRGGWARRWCWAQRR